MGGTDFFDEDLVRKQGNGEQEADSSSGPKLRPAQGVSNLNLTRMAQQREQVEKQLADAAQELETLRQRQANVESEKQTLEEMRKRQEEYVRGKREIVDRLQQSVIKLEKEEIAVSQLAEVIGHTRQGFKDRLKELQSLNDEGWTDTRFQDELSRALALIDEARTDYNKSMAKIESLSARAGEEEVKSHKPVIFEEGRPYSEGEKSFGEWLKIGFAVTLPLVGVLVLIAVFFYLMQNIWI